MNIKIWRVIHKWLSIVMGIFLITWTISGVIMVLPNSWFTKPLNFQWNVLELKSATVSPAQAASAVAEISSGNRQVISMHLINLRGRLLYEISLGDGSTHLVEATTGKEFSIAPALAEEIARVGSGNETQIQSNIIVDKHDFLYPNGSLPIYRIQFSGDPDWYYVSLQNGDLSRSTLLTRLRAGIASLHTFEPMRMVVSNDKIRKATLLGVSLVLGLFIITGYVLFFQPYARKYRKAKSTKNTEEKN